MKHVCFFLPRSLPFCPFSSPCSTFFLHYVQFFSLLMSFNGDWSNAPGQLCGKFCTALGPFRICTVPVSGFSCSKFTFLQYVWVQHLHGSWLFKSRILQCSCLLECKCCIALGLGYSSAEFTLLFATRVQNFGLFWALWVHNLHSSMPLVCKICTVLSSSSAKFCTVPVCLSAKLVDLWV